ncbi:MAG: toxin-antitoxin system HicB family antitoxin [Mycobacteriales bacterium]
MSRSTYVEALRADLSAAAALGGPEIARAGELVAGALEPAWRLVILDVLSDVADDLTVALDGPTVEVRLRGREPEVVVHHPVQAPAVGPVADDEGTARMTLRLPETLKSRAEAAATIDGVSVNTWLVRAVARALEPSPTSGGPGPRRVTGFGRA